ncbi:PDZ domain-containing protein [bacterium]|nr:PDZ domain-containing protein [bacterium]
MFKKILLLVFILLALFNLQAQEGYIKVTEVTKGSNAENAGIKAGDLIIRYDGISVNNILSLKGIMDKTPNKKVDITVLRGDKELTMQIPAGKLGVMLAEVEPEIELKDDAVVLDGIEPLGWDLMMSNSFHGSLLRVLNYMGEKVDYTYLMGVSGAAFRLHFFDGWCPSSPDPTCGYDCGMEAIKAMGYKATYYMKAGIAEPSEEEENAPIYLSETELLNIIKTSIDNGMPVIAIELIDVPEWGVITGYQDGGKELLCRTYYDKTEGYNLSRKFPWLIVVLGDKLQERNDKDNYRRSLKIAYELYTTGKYDKYFSGIKAYEEWIRHLETFNPTKLDSAKYFEDCLANAWIYERLKEDRNYAARYLENIAPEMGDLSPDLLKLAKVYREEIAILNKEKTVAPYPWTLKSRSDWSDEMREMQSVLLEEALKRARSARDILAKIVNPKGMSPNSKMK